MLIFVALASLKLIYLSINLYFHIDYNLRVRLVEIQILIVLDQVILRNIPGNESDHFVKPFGW